jgi:sulfoxide reductase catalytic subunit YedY
MKYRRNPAHQHLRSEITPEAAFLDRRKLIGAGAAAAGVALGGGAACSEPQAPEAGSGLPAPGDALSAKPGARTVADPQTTEEAATQYNNFYEFGTDKSEPARYAKRMTVAPWSVRVEGLAEATGAVALADFIDWDALEERVYRLRCVEAWSMVIPWIGVPMGPVLAKFKPKPEARYVQFETYLNRREMPGVIFPALDWPYVEGLRMDEAMHDLAFFAVGMYGKALPRQNGAPIRVVAPWKYGFKSIKSVVAVRFLAEQPETSWNKSAPREYGFYSNVNPEVDHPRWSQASERVIDGKSLNKRRDTDMFNGYPEVASLYAGMDLAKFY